MRLSEPSRSRAFLLDLVIYLSVMFLVREVYFPGIGFIANGLMWSFTTLAVAVWRMRVRRISWKELGLRRPEDWRVAVVATGAILGMAVLSIVAFEMARDLLDLGLAPDSSDASAVSRFGELRGNWPLFLTIIPFVWLESFLEEILDRGFLMNWIERPSA